MLIFPKKKWGSNLFRVQGHILGIIFPASLAWTGRSEKRLAQKYSVQRGDERVGGVKISLDRKSVV